MNGENKMNFRKLVALLIVLVLAVGMVACGNDQPADPPDPAPPEPPVDVEPTPGGIPELTEPVEIIIWNTWSDHHVALFQELLDEFNAYHPMVTAIQQQQPFADFNANVLNSVRAGVGPDITTAFSSIAVNYVAEDLLVNFTPFLNDERIGIPNFRNSIPEGSYRDITQFRDGQVFMIPTIATGPVFIYNRTLFEELNLDIPTTWSELERVGRIITEHTGSPAFGVDSVVCLFQKLILQAGSDYIDVENRTVMFDNDIALEKLTWFSDLVDEGVFRLVGGDNFFSNPFGAQAVASYIGSSAGYGFVMAAVDDAFEVGIAPVQQEGPVQWVPNYGFGWVAFSSTPERDQAAYELLRFMSRPDMAARWAINFGAIPIVTDALDNPDFLAFAETNAAVQALAEQSARIGWLPQIPGADMVRNEIDRMMESAALGILSPAEALADAVAASDRELGSR
jgi:multiple sugar transport system substrate-binding protein